jgi:predicted DsbA family dithiol-disulfide isomerase
MSVRIHTQLSGIRVRTSRVGVCVVGGELIRFDVFFDYQCPFVYRMAGLIDAVRQTGERDLDVRWRYFSLTQVNSKDDGWTVWDAPASELVRGRLAFQAAEAARRQGRFDDLHQPLLQARHRDGLDLDDPHVAEQLAAGAGLDMARFRRDVADPSILEALATDHLAAVAEHGVFGTPTLVFASGPAAYVRLASSASQDGVLDVFDRLMTVAAGEPRILEIKRPHRR